MIKAWERIKKWLIHKLGGFTQDELKVVKYEFMPPPQTKNIITLKAEGTYDAWHNPPREWIEDRLLRDLATQLKPYVEWVQCDDRCRIQGEKTFEVKRTAVLI